MGAMLRLVQNPPDWAIIFLPLVLIGLIVWVVDGVRWVSRVTDGHSDGVKQTVEIEASGAEGGPLRRVLLDPLGRSSPIQFLGVFLFVVVNLVVIRLYIIEVSPGLLRVDLPTVVGVMVSLTYWIILPLVPVDIYLMFVATVRRFRDTGNSPRWTLLLFVPIVNIGLLVFLLFTPRKRREKPLQWG